VGWGAYLYYLLWLCMIVGGSAGWLLCGRFSIVPCYYQCEMVIATYFPILRNLYALINNVPRKNEFGFLRVF